MVTKTYPASDIGLLAGLGVRDVGENKDQEAAAKHAECADLDVRWHFIGRLQSNKARSVAGYADLVHSVDRLSLVTALDRAAHRRERRLACLLQVSLDGDPERGGVPVGDLPALAEAAAAAPALDLEGIMAVAPLGADPRGRLRSAAGAARRRPRLRPRCPGDLGRDERRPGGGRWPPARHTCVSAARSSERARRSGNVDDRG